MSVHLCADLCSVKMVKHRITQTTTCDNLGTLVLDAKDFDEIRMGSPPVGQQIQIG